VIASLAVSPLRPASLRRRGACAGLLALALALGADRAGAQDLADQNEIALRWTRGDWAAPLLCEKDGEARRGLRRVVIGAGSRDERPPQPNRMVFHPLRLPAGVRCTTDTGEPQPDVAGALTFHLEGISRPDLGVREFQETLQRDGGFQFVVRAGRLEIDGKPVDFTGGSARFETVRRGSDAWRRLQDLPSPHKLTLSLEAPDGTQVRFDLAQAGPDDPRAGREGAR
jgi:hypothetical protein